MSDFNPIASANDLGQRMARFLSTMGGRTARETPSVVAVVNL